MAFAFSVFSMQAQAQNTSSPATKPGALTVDHVVNVVGTSDLKSNVSGNLVFDESRVSFVARDSTVEVPLKSIKAFSISRADLAPRHSRKYPLQRWVLVPNWCQVAGGLPGVCLSALLKKLPKNSKNSEK
jgi:hypothetical protein